MGMYDYLNGEQVKCFYNVFYYNDEVIHSGGNLYNYDIGDCLPITSLYYKYDKDLIIFDYRDEFPIHIIKEGKLKYSKECKDLSNEDLGTMVIDNFGRELNIKSIKDFNQIRLDFQEHINILDNIRIKYPELQSSPNIHSSTKEKEIWLNAHREYEKELDSFISPMNKWFIDRYIEEKTFGEYLECLSWEEDINSEKFHSLSSKIKEMIKKDKKIVDKYIIWLDGYSKEDKIKDIIKFL